MPTRSPPAAARLLPLATLILFASCAGNSGLPDWDGDGSPDSVDCAPADPTRYPGAADAVEAAGETPVDQNCDGIDGVDADGDGVASVDSGGTDCNDADASVHPAAGEVPAAVELPDNPVDEDCDGELLYCDRDGDGVLGPDPACGGSDCDDSNAACRTEADCADADADGQRVCDQDCDDENPLRGEGFPELCDGLDDDCDASLPPGEADADGDGLAACEGDCDDANPAVLPGAAELCDGLDGDCDGTVPATESDGDGDGDLACFDCDDGDPAVQSLDADGDGVSLCDEPVDCDDADAGRWPGAADPPADGLDANCDGVDGVDGDGDGLVAGLSDCDDGTPACGPAADCLDADLDGYRVCDGDCDDGRASVFPGAVEDSCDGLDSDCDGSPPTDEDPDGDGDPACSDCDESQASVNTLDSDGDGFDTCPPDLADPTPADCDDDDPASFPGAPDSPDNGADENCDGIDGVDEDGDGLAKFLDDCDDEDAACAADPDCDDSDGDGFRLCDGDCDDDVAAMNPGAVEDPCDGLDTDCSEGGTPPLSEDQDGDGDPACEDCDDNDPIANTLDADGDGFDTCPPDAFDPTPVDCDDGDALLYPDDLDLDGSTPCDEPIGDCSDFNPIFAPGLPEACDGLDNDCDGVVPEDEVDADGDLFRVCQGDCDDSSAAIYPLASDAACDGLDTNCLYDGDEVDDDGDGSFECAGDCDDADPLVEGLDADGDGQTTCGDDCSDTDTSTTCNVDCDDGNPLTGEGFEESCDGLDNDCDGAVPNVVVIGEVDDDLDGYVECQDWFGSNPSVLGGGDCDDTSALYNPSVTDVCDGIDTNCNGIADDENDFDLDGYCAGDCDDTDPDLHPGIWSDLYTDNVDEDCGGTDGYEAQGDFGWDYVGEAYSSLYVPGAGTRVVTLGDITGDGISEWAQSSPNQDAYLSTTSCSSGCGVIRVFAGRASVDPTTPYPAIWGRRGYGYPPVLANLGQEMLSVPDVDGDGNDDLLIFGYIPGTYNARTVLYTSAHIASQAYSSLSTPASDWDARFSNSEDAAYASPIAGVHADADALADLVFLARTASGERQIKIVSGAGISAAEDVDIATGSDWTIAGGSLGYPDSYGETAGTAGDLDGDGGREIFVATNGGAALHIFWSHSLDASEPNLSVDDAAVHVSGFYFASIAASLYVRAADFDGDGLDDLAVRKGCAWDVWSGADLVAGGSFGSDSAMSAGLYLPACAGTPAMNMGDVDGDGLAELIATDTSNATPGCATVTGYGCVGAGVAILRSGGTISGLDPIPDLELYGPPGKAYGLSAAIGADVSGDGIGDVLVGWQGSMPDANLYSGGVRVEVGRLPD